MFEMFADSLAVKLKKMGIPSFNKEELRGKIRFQFENVVKAVQFKLQKVGEEFVTNARNNGTYKDHTGNLRGSIGYVLFKNGIQVNDNFKSYPPSQASLKGTGIGPDQAKMIIDEIITKYPTGLVLVCVAGMEYAAAVESKGFDVITSSALIAKNDLQKGLEELRQKVSKQ